MRIVQIMPEFGLAGAETMCENLIMELIAHGHEVIVISMYDYRSAITERLEYGGVKIYYLHKKIGLDMAMIGRIRRILALTKADVVHTHRNCAQYAMPAAILCGVKCRVHTVHSVARKENGLLARKTNHIFFRFFGLIPTALSPVVQTSILEEYKLKPELVPVIFNGIDLSKCKPKKVDIQTAKFIILHIGRFAEAKNHGSLLEAFALFHKQHPEAVLQLIGDGELRPEMQKKIKSLGIENSVEMLGLREDVFSFLHKADLFVLPSLYEGIPLSIIEAMGTGLPIIASRVGGIPDMIQDGENGILCDPDVKSIADAMVRMYQDRSLREKCGRNALKTSKRFSAEIMAEQYIQLYQQVLDKSSC